MLSLPSASPVKASTNNIKHRHPDPLVCHRPFCNFSDFTTKIRSRLGTVGKKKEQPSLEERKAGFRELRIALKVSSAETKARFSQALPGHLWRSGLGVRSLEIASAVQSITMRRLKTDKVNGQPIITLPPKTFEVRELEFTPEELDFYESMEKKSQARFIKYVRTNFKANYHHILVRSCCLICRLGCWKFLIVLSQCLSKNHVAAACEFTSPD